MEELLASEADSLIGISGRWQVTYKELTMMVITDEVNDRMRIITPIAETENMDKELLSLCLEANYHSVLDVKYAISDGVLWSVFIHPLSSLTDKQLKSAVSQVYTAAMTFGSSFTSGALIFGSSDSEPNEKPRKLKKTTP